MPAPTITPLPDPPIRSGQPATFTAKAEAWVAAMGEFTDDVNAFGAYLDTLGLDPVDQTKTVIIAITDPNGSALAVGDGLAYVPIPSTVGGKSLVSAKAFVTTVSSSGAITVQVHNLTGGVDMLSTPLSIDASESNSTTAATPVVIDTANDQVATNDMLRIDCDGAGAGAKGLIVELQFQ